MCKKIAEWKTEAGYDACMIVFEEGNINGYVGVHESHPAFGLNYYVYTIDIDDIEKWPSTRVKIQRAINDIEVHGGLTYADLGDGKLMGEDIWWFGFDTKHCCDAGNFEFAKKELWDIMDEKEKNSFKRLQQGSVVFNDATWKSPEYVKSECEELARQLRCIKEMFPLDE